MLGPRHHSGKQNTLSPDKEQEIRHRLKKTMADDVVDQMGGATLKLHYATPEKEDEMRLHLKKTMADDVVDQMGGATLKLHSASKRGAGTSWQKKTVEQCVTFYELGNHKGFASEQLPQFKKAWLTSKKVNKDFPYLRNNELEVLKCHAAVCLAPKELIEFFLSREANKQQRKTDKSGKVACVNCGSVVLQHGLQAHMKER